MGFVLIVLSAIGSGVSGLAQVGEARLFALQGEAKAVAEANRSSVASVREAEIVFPMDTAVLMQGRRLTIPLFDNRESLATSTQLERRASDDLTWRGKIGTGDTAGDVVITFRKGFVAGLIYGPNGVYEIVPPGSKHFLVELDQQRFPECGGGIDEKSDTGATRDSESMVGVDSGDRIDVILVYTTASKTFLGGDAQAQVFAQQAIDTTNTAYINSKIRQRVRLVHAQEFVYTETASASTDLSNLRANAGILALRDTHKADLVAAIGEISGACGIGYLLNSV